MYKVGNFLYLYSKQKNQIYSAKIVEEITIKSLNGEKQDYTINLKKQEDSCFSLSEIQKTNLYKVFKDIDSLKHFMMKNAENYINNLISNCEKSRIKLWGKSESDIISEVAESNTQEIISTDKIQIVLDDGIKANIIDNTGTLDSNE